MVRGIRPGDVVRCERNGVRFMALVTGKSSGVLDVEPFSSAYSWRSVKPRQVREHWRKARA